MKREFIVRWSHPNEGINETIVPTIVDAWGTMQAAMKMGAVGLQVFMDGVYVSPDAFKRMLDRAAN